jgi:hypothetical protein
MAVQVTDNITAPSWVLSSAQQLSKESTHLKIEVDKFLITVRAA